ncbi:MAG: hypothetical protein ACRDHM_06905 [Actinomycetota bacterium]
MRAGYEVTLDAGEYVVNAMPPGPPVVPTAHIRVVSPGGTDLELIAIVRAEAGPEVLRAPLRPGASHEGAGVAQADVVLAGEDGRPLPEGTYLVDVAEARPDGQVGSATFRVVTIQ